MMMTLFVKLFIKNKDEKSNKMIASTCMEVRDGRCKSKNYRRNHVINS